MPNPNNQNNQNNQNENNLTEVKKILDAYENQLNGMHFNNAELNELHVRFKTALHDLNTATDHFYTRDDRGNYPTIDAHEFTLLDDLYQQAYRTATSLENGLQQADPEQLTKNDRIWKNVYDTMMNMVRDVLGQDLQHLHSVQRNGNETLPAIIEQARTHVYNVDGQAMERFGAGLSSRLAITIPGENGDVRGFFTESVTTDQEKEIEQIRREMVEQNPEMEPVLRNIQLQNYDFSQGIQVTKMNLVDGNSEFLNNNMLAILPDRAAQKLVTENGKLMSDYLSFLERYEGVLTKYLALQADKTGENDKLDQRNCAMSTMADLLGMDELLAHAEPVQIKFTKNGREQTLRGSFMRLAEGQDCNRQIPGQGLLNLDAPVDGDTASVKKQLADLQVLDYICGNVDRHRGNMIYQVDESDPAHTRLVGVKGIDNDDSFSTYTGRSPYKSLTVPEEMRAIRSRTAALVEGLDRDMLKTMLRNYNLPEANLDAVWERTQRLQNAIRDGREFFRDKPENELSSEHLRVVDDDAFERLSLNALADPAKSSYFNRITDITTAAAKNYMANVQLADQNQYLEGRAAFHDAFSELKDIRKDLQDADSAFRRRPEYREVQRTTKILEEMKSLNMLTLSPDAMRERMPRLRDAMTAAEAYLQHKQTEFNRERGEVSAQFEAGSISERAKNKAMNKIKEKYKGADSADAKRIRAVVKLKKMLRKSLEAGEKALQAADDYSVVRPLSDGQGMLQEIRRRSPQNQAPQQAMQQPADVHQEPARENQRGRMRLSAADLQEKLDGQAPDKGRKSVPHKAAQQKEVKRSNSMG